MLGNFGLLTVKLIIILSNIKGLTKTSKLDTTSFIDYIENKQIRLHGGRKEGLKRLNKVKLQKICKNSKWMRPFLYILHNSFL